MVLDPPKKPVNVTLMIIFSFIPILSIYAGWRIQKFWLLLVINFGVGLVTGYFLGWWGIFVQVPIAVFVVRHYARAYNAKVAASVTPSS